MSSLNHKAIYYILLFDLDKSLGKVNTFTTSLEKQYVICLEIEIDPTGWDVVVNERCMYRFC